MANTVAYRPKTVSGKSPRRGTGRSGKSPMKPGSPYGLKNSMTGSNNG